MYTKITNPYNVAVDALWDEIDYAPGGYHIAVAGVGKAGANAVYHQKLSGYDTEQVDSLTLFTYEKTDTSPRYQELCKQTCKDCFWLFVLVDPEDKNAIDLACELADYSQNEAGTHCHDIRVCIMLETYHGTQIEQMLQMHFDKIIFIEEYEQFFVPVEILFVHPHGSICIGIDYADYYGLIEHSRYLFLTQSVHTDAGELTGMLQTKIQEKTAEHGIKYFNIFSYFSCAEDGPLDAIVDSAVTVRDYARTLDKEAEFGFNSVYHTHSDESVVGHLLLCAVSPPKSEPADSGS